MMPKASQSPRGCNRVLQNAT